MRVKEYEKYFAVAWLLGIAVLAVELYYRCYGMLRNFGLTHKYIDMVIGYLHRSGLLSSRYAVKSVALSFLLPADAGEDWPLYRHLPTPPFWALSVLD